MMRSLLLLIAATLAFQTSAQIRNLQTLQGKVIKRDALQSYADGSPYVLETFTEGYIEFPEKTFKGVFLRFNAMDQRFELEKENSEVLVLNTTRALRVGLDRKRPDVYGIEFVKRDNNWFQELSRELIFKKIEISIVEDVQPGYNTAERRKRFAVQESLFILENTNDLRPFRLKKKEILRLAKHPKELKDYAQSNQLKFKKMKDVVQMLEYDRRIN